MALGAPVFSAAIAVAVSISMESALKQRSFPGKIRICGPISDFLRYLEESLGKQTMIWAGDAPTNSFLEFSIDPESPALYT